MVWQQGDEIEAAKEKLANFGMKNKQEAEDRFLCETRSTGEAWICVRQTVRREAGQKSIRRGRKESKIEYAAGEIDQ